VTRFVLLALCFAGAAAMAAPATLEEAQVVFLGEQHDNAAHHARQAEIVADIAPEALVFEMLTAEQAGRATPDVRTSEAALEAAIGWNGTGWPPFSMYYPIFAAAPEAAIYGAAIPRDLAGRVSEEGTGAVFGPEAERYGLDEPLPPRQQDAREALQFAAHCDALPKSMLPMMVSIQRLRDAELARVALKALESSGEPVVVITGNGHARTDWGAPAALERVAPEVTVAALGQGETSTGAPDGVFDVIEIGPDVDRGDPCAAFRRDG
jgi:uncharacterized iron-regulated protein